MYIVTTQDKYLLRVTVTYHGAIGGKPLKIDFAYTFKLARVIYPIITL